MWETPRNIAIIIGGVVVLFGGVFGILGYELGKQVVRDTMSHGGEIIGTSMWWRENYERC